MALNKLKPLQLQMEDGNKVGLAENLSSKAHGLPIDERVSLIYVRGGVSEVVLAGICQYKIGCPT